MRLAVLIFLAALGLSQVPVALAGTKLIVKTQTYDVTGETGEALLKAMDRNGPKHGFMTRAIAQTRYTVDWELKVARTGNICRLVRADATLNLFYTFPHAARMAPALQRRWKRFFAGTRTHEETHGRIARDMVKAAHRAISGLEVAHDPRCFNTRREARRRIDTVYAEYEARQVAFDKREHRGGGKVEGLVAALVGRR